MKIKAVSGMMLTLLLVGMLTLAFNIQPVKSEPATWTVDDDGPADFSSIQEAINAASQGDIIYVYNGTYYENVVINKSVSLVGENRVNTIVDGMHNGDVVLISADNVVVSRFTIINSKNQGGYAGINSYNVKNCTIKENNILSNWRGIWFYNCTNIIIHGNSILNTTESLAIWVHYSNSAVISSNIVTNNPAGVYLYYSDNSVVCRNSITDNNYYGLTLQDSKGNLIIENIIANSSEWNGVALWDSYQNTITANDISNNPYGLRFGFSSNNTIYHNNFIDNAIQAYDTYREYDSEPSVNSWDDGYPSGGNYWSDYNGTDFYLGPHQNVTGSDGIGDTPYVIDENNADRYPLVNPWTPTPPVITATIDIDPDTLNLKSKGRWITCYIELSEGYNVNDIDRATILLNGTIPVDPFWIDKPLESVIGDYDNDTLRDLMVKFSRKAVSEFILSKSIMYGNVTLTMTGELYDRTLFEGGDVIKVGMPSNVNSHDDECVDIYDIAIPEFPTWTSMLLILIVLTFAIAIYKRRLLKTPIH